MSLHLSIPAKTRSIWHPLIRLALVGTGLFAIYVGAQLGKGFLGERVPEPLLTDLRVVVCLGRIAFDGLLAHESRLGRSPRRASFVFAHGAEYKLPGGLIVIASYHPSLQNTNTGKLTRPMLLNVFKRARKLAGL